MDNIVLIHTPVCELQEDRLEPPLGLLYLATYLKQYGIKVSLVDLSGQKADRSSLSSTKENQWNIPYADYYGFSTYSTNYRRTLQIKENLFSHINPNAKMIAGGPHASALPAEVLKDFDYVIIGEGERSLLALAQGRCIDSIIQGQPIENLDDLPFPDYSLVDINSYKRIVAGKRSFSILSSRGCPYDCLFCNSNVMGGHQQTRFRSPRNVIGEIRNILDEYGDVTFRFQDDIFGLSHRWLDNFTSLVKPFNIIYRAFVRANQCAKDSFTDLLYEGGCRHVALGIESGSDKILQAMQKGQTVEDGIQGIVNAKKSGLIVRIYLIVGFPGETWDTVKETVEFVDKTRPDEFVVYPLIPYPGTLLYQYPDFYGLKNIDKDFTKYFQIYGDKQSHFVYDLEYIDRDELQAMKDYVISELEKMQLSWAKDSKGYV